MSCLSLFFCLPAWVLKNFEDFFFSVVLWAEFVYSVFLACFFQSSLSPASTLRITFIFLSLGCLPVSKLWAYSEFILISVLKFCDTIPDHGGDGPEGICCGLGSLQHVLCRDNTQDVLVLLAVQHLPAAQPGHGCHWPSRVDRVPLACFPVGAGSARGECLPSWPALRTILPFVEETQPHRTAHWTE